MLVLDRAGHQHVVVGLAPFDGEIAAGQLTVTLRPVRLSRAAATAAAQAAEPQALVRPAPRSQVRITMRSRDRRRGERDVGALRKQRMVFEQRADLVADRRRIGSSTQKIACGLPMLTTDGECRIGAPRGPISSSIARVSANSSRQRNFVPAETRRAHVDGEQPRPIASRQSSPAWVSKMSLALPVSFAEQSGDAAHAVAAGAGLRAVIVVDADRGIGAGARRIKRHQLVEGSARAAARAPRRRSASARRADRRSRSRCRDRSS